MADSDFHEKLRAHRAHMAAVPAAVSEARTLVTHESGWEVADKQRLVGITAGSLLTLVREVDRLQAREKELLLEAREAEREFQREARDIAAEARWEDQEETRGGHY